jgi:DNA-binding CsgD family transcriptional regulator/tetratricopeptide (TPR) repeat protein
VNDTWPLLGRQAELAELSSVVDSVFDGSTETIGVVLTGRSGVGKSRLLHAVLARAAGHGGRAELVRATRAAASVPLAAMSCLFPDDQPEHEHDAFELFRLTARRLRESGPVLLAVDDAHLLDDASAGLVHHLAAEGCVTVVATVCAGYRVADAVTALWKDELARSVVVPPLPDGVIDELVRQALPGRVSGVTHARLRQLSDGNPLYLRELLNAGVTAGSLWERGGFWQWAESGGGWRLHELVRARLEAAGPAGREVTELVACGEPVPLAMVEDHDGLAAAEQAGLLELVVDRRRTDVRLTHPVYGEVLRSSLPPIRGRAIHRNLLRSLRKTPLRRRDDLLRLATWQLAGGEPADPEVLVPAARQAAARHDLALAERLARRAADTGEPRAVALLGQVLSLRGRHRDSAALLAGGPPSHAGSRERTRWTVQQASTLYFALARPDEAAEVLRTTYGESHCVGVGVGGLRAMMLVAESKLDETVAVARPVLSSEEELVDARLFAYAASVTALALLGHTENALLLAGDGQRLMRAHQEQVLLGGAYLKIGRCAALLLKGGLAEARDLTEQEYRDAARTEDRAVTALWAAQRGVVAQVRGDLTLATTTLQEAVALEEHEDRQPMHALHELILAGCLAMTGDTTGARRWQRRAEELADDIPRVYAAQMEVNRAMILAACGDRRRAVESAHRAAELARTNGQLTQEAYALYEAARHGGSHQVAERLAELANRTDSELTAAFADYAGARARRDGPMLDEVAATFEALGTPLMAAEAAFAAGHAYQRSGRTRHATIANERGRLLAARCPGARTDTLVTAGPAVTLTDREREIARLAASGMSSNDIAGHLNLSVRTVDNRLGHVYAKLGISGRAELGGIFTD